MRKTLPAAIALFVVMILPAQIADAAPPKKASSEDHQMTQLIRELGLTKKQSDSIRAIVKKTDADMRKLMQSKESEGSKAKKRQVVAEHGRKQFLAVLTPEQRKRFDALIQRQIASRPRPRGQSVQRGMSFVDAVEAALKSVGLSAQQKSKTDSIIKDFWKKRTAIRQDKKLTEAQAKAKLRPLKDQTMTRIAEVLTPTQRKKFGEEVARLGRTPAAANPASGKPQPATTARKSK